MRMRKTLAEAKKAAILEAAEKDPKLDSVQLGERFGLEPGHIRRILQEEKRVKQHRCKHCGRVFGWEYKLKNHLAIKELKGYCTKAPGKSKPRKKPCPHCGKRLMPAGLGAHLKRRKQLGRCPTGERSQPKPKPKHTERIDNWTLEDCELLG